MQNTMMISRLSLLILLIIEMVASNNKTEEKKTHLITQQFFDFQKEVEDFFSEGDNINSINITLPLSNDTLINDPGIMAERDYDFYSDDTDTAESSDVSVRAGIYSQYDIANRRNSDDYDYEYEADDRGYGHSSGGYSDHGGGYDSGYKVQPKKPGPYGYASPNFKCEKSSETLYVTKTEMTYDKKCYNVYKVQCTEGYDEGKVG